MANYYASARTNAFRVKDPEKFREWVDSVGSMEVIEGPSGYFTLLCHDEDGWPNFYYDDETDEVIGIDICEEIVEHLAENSVAVFMEVGAEKLRYLIGYAVAVHPNGETVIINLDDIYEKAEKAFGDEAEITGAYY